MKRYWVLALTPLFIGAIYSLTFDVVIENSMSLRFAELSSNGTNYISLSAPDAITANQDCVLEDDSSPIPDSCVGNGVDNSVITICTQVPTTHISIDSFIGTIYAAGTINKAWCIVTGTVTTAPTADLAECASDGTSCGANTTAALTCDADGDSTTTFGGAAGSGVDADDWMSVDITNVPSVLSGMLTLCFTYTPS